MKSLYLISTESLQYPAILNRSEHGLSSLSRGCILKVGEATNVDIRVETLDGTFVFEKPILLKEWKNSNLNDRQVHSELEKRGFVMKHISPKVVPFVPNDFPSNIEPSSRTNRHLAISIEFLYFIL